MRVVVQRCSRAEVRIDGTVVGRIGQGFLLLVGVSETDTQAEADLLAKKIAQLRVFEDAEEALPPVVDAHLLVTPLVVGTRAVAVEQVEPFFYVESEDIHYS